MPKAAHAFIAALRRVSRLSGEKEKSLILTALGQLMSETPFPEDYDEVISVWNEVSKPLSPGFAQSLAHQHKRVSLEAV